MNFKVWKYNFEIFSKYEIIILKFILLKYELLYIKYEFSKICNSYLKFIQYSMNLWYEFQKLLFILEFYTWNVWIYKSMNYESIIHTLICKFKVWILN